MKNCPSFRHIIYELAIAMIPQHHVTILLFADIPTKLLPLLSCLVVILQSYRLGSKFLLLVIEIVWQK